MGRAGLAFSIRNLSVVFWQNVVLDVPVLDIPRGKVVFLLGHSGSGKTTFLETLGLMNSYAHASSQIIYYPPEGSEGISYQSLWGDEERLAAFRKTHFTFMFQDTHLFPEFSISENVALTQIIKNVPHEEAIRDARRHLARLGIGEKSNDRINELSGGERQRAAFARALEAQGDILFADEPTGNLGDDDAELVMSDIRNYVDESGGRNTAIVVSHNTNLALAFGDQVIVLQEKNHQVLPENVFCSPGTHKGLHRFEGILTEKDLRASMRGVANYVGPRPGPPVEVPVHFEEAGPVLDSELKSFYGPRSTEDLSLKKRMNLILVAILGFALLSIGFSVGSLDVLRQKMQDPFVNWITIDVPMDKRDSLASVTGYLEDSVQREKYSIRKIAPFKKFPLNIYNPKAGGVRDSYGRTIDIQDPILTEINQPDILVEGTLFTGPLDIGLIVTEEFLEYAGADRGSGFVTMAMAVGEEKRTVPVPVPIRGVVHSLPGQSQFMATEYFENKRNYDPAGPFNPVHARMISLFCEGPEANSRQVLDSLQEFVKRIDSLGNRIPQLWIEELQANEKPMRSGSVVKASFIPDLTLAEIEAITERFRRTHTFAFRLVPIFEYPNTPMERLPEYSRYNRLSIHVTNLEHVSALRETIFEQFGLEIDMAKVEALNNYRMVTRLTATLSAFIIGISVVSVCIFMIYILYVHLYKNRGHLGMLKAFGASPKTLKSIYLQRMLRSLLLSATLALVVVVAFGYLGALRTLVSLWMPVEPGQTYFNIINSYPLIFVVTLVLLTFWSTTFTANFILRLSPGDLIYDRLDAREERNAASTR